MSVVTCDGHVWQQHSICKEWGLFRESGDRISSFRLLTPYSQTLFSQALRWGGPSWAAHPWVTPAHLIPLKAGPKPHCLPSMMASQGVIITKTNSFWALQIWGLLLSGLSCLCSEGLQRGLRSKGCSLPGKTSVHRGPLLPTMVSLFQGNQDVDLRNKTLSEFISVLRQPDSAMGPGTCLTYGIWRDTRIPGYIWHVVGVYLRSHSLISFGIRWQVTLLNA